MDIAKVSTIIFDLGGVIVDLDVQKTLQGFSALSGLTTEEVRKLYFSTLAFTQFEKGDIDSEQFRNAIRTIFNGQKAKGRKVEDEEIDTAWNAMITGLPKTKLDLMQRLKEKFQVFILSNTNTIHANYLHQVSIPAVSTYNSFETFVHKVYYSHELRMRKPDEEIFHHVLHINGLKPEETLFLDDNRDNVQTAEKIGIQTLHILHPDKVTEIFLSI